MPTSIAFALGALSHYASDITGHPAVNQAVAISYPKLRAKFGPLFSTRRTRPRIFGRNSALTWRRSPKQRYAPEQYHDFIGFEVSKELLERVFPVVYGLQLKDVLPHEDLAIGSFRYSVSITDSAHDAGGASHSQERDHERGAELSKEDISLSAFACRL